jgi:2-methylisocitrate lyase-like PEP mutase family enzyme
MEQRERAERFRQMHREPPILVIPNAWDVASAMALAALPGCRAIATTSAAVAGSLGWEDGEQAPGDAMVDAAGRIAAAVDVPVTADLERGYGDSVGTARRAWDAGVVGMNFEDSSAGALVSVAEQVDAIRSIRSSVPDLVLNARIDVFLRGGNVEEAVERANCYLAAGRLRVSDPLPRRERRRARPADRWPGQRHAPAGYARPRSPREPGCCPCHLGRGPCHRGLRRGSADRRRSPAGLAT